MSAEQEEEPDASDKLILIFRAALETLTPELASENVDKVEIVLALGVAMCGCATDRGVPDARARRVVARVLCEAASAWARFAEGGRAQEAKRVH